MQKSQQNNGRDEKNNAIAILDNFIRTKTRRDETRREERRSSCSLRKVKKDALLFDMLNLFEKGGVHSIDLTEIVNVFAFEGQTKDARLLNREIR